MYYFCLFTAWLYFGHVLHNVYINFFAALALYALGQWLFITALSSWQCLYQRELVGPMRWVKVFFCYIDRWFVFEKRQDHNLIVHLVFKIALHSMTCIVNPSTVVSLCTGTQKKETLTNCVITPCMVMKTIGIPSCTGTPGQPPHRLRERKWNCNQL